MSYHIITVDSPTAYLNYEKGQFICDTDDGVKQLPLEDVAAVVVCSFSAKIEMKLLMSAAELGVPFIFCENFQPKSIMLPAQRSTDTALTRAWQVASVRFIKDCWQKTLDAKCHNQYSLAAAWNPEHNSIPEIERIKFYRHSSRESTISRLFWSVFRDKLELKDFKRLRGEGTVNCFLDYGYAVILARILQCCFACGLDPTFGIGHATSERSTALAYDLMEPFRPLVDAKVYTWVRKLSDLENITLDRPFKQHLLTFLQEDIYYQGAYQKVQTVMEKSVRSFRKALLAKTIELYEPWMATNLKWDGC